MNLFSRITTWPAGVANGIQSLYASVINATTVKTENVETNKLCIGSTCVTEDQLKRLPQEGVPAPEGVGNASSTEGATSNLEAELPSDTEAPVLELIGNATSTLNIGDTYVDPGATVTDNVDHNLGVQVTGTVDTNTVGEYTLTYNATDSAGNKALELTRIVTVVDPFATSTPVDLGAATSTLDIATTIP